MTTIWLQPPDKTKPPIEVEYTKEKIVPLMVKGHRQVPPPDSKTASESPAKILLRSPEGQTLEVEAVPDILTPYMEKGWVEVSQ